MLRRKVRPHIILQNDQCFVLLIDADILMNAILTYNNHAENCIFLSSIHKYWYLKVKCIKICAIFYDWVWYLSL